MNLPHSDDELLLLHNPGCSKSRALKAALVSRGVAFAERAYLEHPLDRAELVELCRRLEVPLERLVRSKQAEFSAQGLSATSSPSELLDALVREPLLLERPILIRGARAAIGRPDTQPALDLLPPPDLL